jgi:hypothetical protein
MIYKGPDFLAVTGFGSLSRSSSVSPVEVSDESGRGAESYDSEKAWSSINNSKPPKVMP